MPGTASLAARIVLAEANIAYEPVQVRLKSRRTDDGRDFLDINGKGYVPVLELDDGERITESAAILQYLADLRPETKLAPPAGSLERVRVQEWLNFVASEVHKPFSPLFTAGTGDGWRTACLAKLRIRLAWIDGELVGREWLIGNIMTIADVYLFTVINWVRWVTELSLEAWPSLASFQSRIASRSAVRAALEADGLGNF
jgi:glutathione S-transferase